MKKTDKKYSLIEEINKKSYNSNNSIECFFIEKASQILKDGGVVGIIVPSSILNKANKVYLKTREIILKNFHIVAIYESGSGTFGKTGTNTVTLFLKKKETNPTFAEHFENMVNIWFEGDLETNENELKYSEVLQKYCSHMEYNFEDYKSFLKNNNVRNDCIVTDNFVQNNEVFKEYKTAFEKESATKSFKNTRNFKALTKEEQEKELTKEFIKYAKNIEKDKLLYFGIASDNENQVLIIKTPAGNNEIKKFLGYEWSSGKGNEGIKYLTSQKVNIEDEEDELDEEDKRVLENISSLNNIETPLYNPKNLDDESKINTLIKKNFKNKSFEIPEELKEFVKTANLKDMLDFKRVSFDKAISLNPKNLKPIESSKYTQVNFKDLFLEVKNGKNVNQFDEKGNYKVSRIETIAKGVFDENTIKWTNDSVKEDDFLEKGDILFSHINSVKHLGKTALFDIDEKIIHGINLLKFKVDKNKILPKYAIELFKLDSFKTEIENQAQKAVNQASVNITYLTELYFPLPPLEIQKEIVSECEKVDEELKKAENEIFESKKEIENIIGSVEGEMVSIENILIDINGNSTKIQKNEILEKGKYPVITQEVEKFISGYSNNINPVSDIPLVIFGDHSSTFKYIDFEFIRGADGTVLLKPNNNFNVKYFYYILKNLDIPNKEKYERHFKYLKPLKIPLPPLEIQKEIVLQIEKIEQKIEENKKILEKVEKIEKKMFGKIICNLILK